MVAEARADVVGARVADPADTQDHRQVGAAIVQVGHEDAVGQRLGVRIRCANFFQRMNLPDNKGT